MELLDGRVLSAKIKEELAEKTAERVAKGKKAPHLAAILVGDDPASETYVNSKIKSCHEIGYGSSLFRYDNTLSELELLNKIIEVNNNPEIDGLIVQLPLPGHIDVSKVIDTIDPRKDVDGFHPVNIGKMVKGIPSLLPATPFGITKLLQYYAVPTAGKHCVVIGRSQIVGTPVSILMSRDAPYGNATVTLCHSHTKNLADFTRQADILITAVGRPGTITPDMVKEGVAIIDVGTTRVADPSRKSGFRLRGDVDFDNVKDKCSFITPVPGGVGPMTIASLLLNTMQAAESFA